MKTHNIKLIAAIALCITLTGIRAHASDFKTIYNRMYEKYLDRNTSKETIGGLMKSLSPEGAFVTLNSRYRRFPTQACTKPHRPGLRLPTSREHILP